MATLIAAAVALTVLAPGRAPAAPVERPSWFQNLLDGAERGDAAAQQALGSRYLSGDGVGQDYAEAERWLRKAAELGHASAQNDLGTMYATGRGVKRDDAEAVRWYRKAADQGNAVAEANLGGMYKGGFGVPQDDTEAVRWYRKAAEQGGADGQYELGHMFYSGRGVAQDHSEAVRLFVKAADQGNYDAQVTVASMYALGRHVRMDRAEASRRYLLAGGSAYALLGSAIRSDTDGKYSAAREVFLLIADLPPYLAIAHTFAQLSVGEYAEYGKGSRASREEALQWYGKAAEDGEPEAKAAVARIQRGLWGTANLQALLAARGFDPGARDGRFGKGTLAAAQRYRAAAGLEISEHFVTGIHNRLVAEDDRAVQQASASQRGVARAGSKIDPVAFGNYHALVIGIQNYRAIRVLGTPLADAQEVASVLASRYGFRVKLLKDATKAEILDAIQELRDRLDLGDNLLIYYAGHGEIDPVTQRGYWLPVEADPRRRSTWCPHDDIRNELKAMRARHVAVVADSCYAGVLTRGGEKPRRQGSAEEWVRRMARSRSRTVLTSGGNEPVDDAGGRGGHSVFASAFLSALNENERAIDLESLFNERIGRGVVLESEQTPGYAPMRRAGHEFGDFVLVPLK